MIIFPGLIDLIRFINICQFSSIFVDCLRSLSIYKFHCMLFHVLYIFSFFCAVSGSNLASHMVGSLKKGSKQSMSLPSTAYNTLPAHVHQMRSSPRVISGSNKKSQYHKRSPSSDSGTGSNTPVSSYHSGKVHHTVYLHGKSILHTVAFRRNCYRNIWNYVALIRRIIAPKFKFSDIFNF